MGKIIRAALCAVLCLCVATAPACGLIPLSQQKRQEIQAILDEQFANGNLTAAEYTLASEKLAQEEFDWSRLLQSGIDVGLALLGVKLWRGGINSRKGEITVTP